LLAALHFPPVSHLVEWPDLALGGTLFAINKVVLTFILALFLTVLLFGLAGRKRKLQAGDSEIEEYVPTGSRNLVESAVDFIQDSIVLQTIGPEGLKIPSLMPFLLTMFFFIFFVNIFEVIPGAQMPGNARMAVPIFLAIMVWAIYLITGFKHHGIKYLTGHIFPPGVPKFLYVLVTPIELLQLLVVRPFSLAVRLFANMLAGHLLLVTFAVLTAALFAKTFLLIILPVSFAVLVALTAFEVLVAFLQAFIFTILTAVYIGDSIHAEH
jgi:F-type H+-transporting ATPase subunit a